MFHVWLISLRGDIGWPARSPDLSMCDFFLWGYLKDKVFRHRPHTIEDLKQKITEEIEAIPVETCRKSYESFRDRLQQPSLGTENALYSATRFINYALDNNKKALAILVDLAKAFDTVDHLELLKIMPNFGIVSSSLNWFRSYFQNRRQMVRINGITGDKMYINCGVPQCSVLGPILCILSINSICSLDIEGLIVTYADDTCLLFSGDSWNE
ncbi:Reverse transcriptase domain-containing protein, partial [Aphis craccivora]